MNKVKRILVTLSAISIATIHTANANSDIDTVGRLGGQMSTVRLMLEVYSLVGMDIKYSNPGKILNKSIAEYEALISYLETHYKDDAIKQSIARSKKKWIEFKEALLTSTTLKDKAKLKEMALFVHAHTRGIIVELSTMKKYLLTKQKSPEVKYLNAAIEIGASARRLSAHYMMKCWKLDDPTIEKHWNNGVKIYSDSIKLLKSSSFSSDPKFEALLKSSERGLKYFIMLGQMQKAMPTLVHKKAKDIYNESIKMQETIKSTIHK